MATPYRPHLLARAPLVDRLNGWLERAWGTGLLPKPTLDPEQLWGSAALAAPAEGECGGRSAEDAADFRARLLHLCSALRDEAALNPIGLAIAHGQLVRVIRQRLTLGALWQHKPKLLQQDIAPPILVVGQMRSGTTRMHRLLAADPAHAGTRFCDSWHPVPRQPDTRPFWSGVSLFMARRLNPWMDSIHPFGVTRPDEELGWLASALNHCAYEAQWRVPSFTAYSEAVDPAPVYSEFDRILRTDAAFSKNARLARILKVPQFAEDLPALLAQFPHARVVRTLRDPEAMTASAVSLVANQMAIQSDDADVAWIEEECRRKIALREDRMDRALLGFDGPLAMVEFDALSRDWESEIERVYAALGIDLNAQAIKAMRTEQGRSRKSAHLGHAGTYQAFASA